jgi:hypothetical protein
MTCLRRQVVAGRGRRDRSVAGYGQRCPQPRRKLPTATPDPTPCTDRRARVSVDAVRFGTVRRSLWLLPLLVGLACGVVAMHSLPTGTSHHPASTAAGMHDQPDLMGVPSNPPEVPQPPPDRDDHGLQHLCLAVLGALAIGALVTSIRHRRPRVTLGSEAERALASAQDRPPDLAGRPLLAFVGVLRL